MMIAVAATATAQQTNTLDTFRQSYEQREAALLMQYGTELDTFVADAKKKGDLDGVLILQAEQARFADEKTVPAPAEAEAAVRPVSEAYYRARATMLERYVATLDGLVKKMVVADQIEDAKVVRAEKDKAASLLADMRTALPARAMGATPKPEKPVSPPPAFKPKAYVDDTKGWAGMEPSNNIYAFKVEGVGRRATFRFWASGDIGTDTAGDIVLSGPDGHEQIIRKWQPSDFNIAANTVSSYKNLRPISCDISAHVKQPGEYRFAFRWGGSPVGLSIWRVEMELE